jgi:hypothetical protein
MTLGRTRQPKRSVAVRGMVASPVNKRTGWRQVDRLTSSVHLRMQDIHHSDVVTGFDETVGERGPDKTCSASDEDEHRC